MSSSMAPKCLTFKATAAIEAYTAVKGGASNQYVSQSTAKTDKSVGIAQNAATVADDKVEVALDGGGKAKLGAGGCAFGDLLAPTTDGKLIVTTTAGDRYVAIAMEDGVEGDIVGVQMKQGLI